MRFSERYGYKPIRDVIQIESISNDLRVTLWSLFTLHVCDEVRDPYGSSLTYDSNLNTFCKKLWFHYYKRPLDTLGYKWSNILSEIRHDFFAIDWYEVYDFIEFVAQNFPYGGRDSFIAACNVVFEKEFSAYRFVDDLITRITDEEEVAEIELALDKAQGPARTHLRRALELLSNRENPDYRNSIKESISAIESLVGKTLGQKGTLGQLIKKLEDEIGLHPALGKAFGNLYGYTSDEDGIRHAILESKTVTFEDAKFFLVICSAFANFVTAKIDVSKS